jgi:hypothetical protein
MMSGAAPGRHVIRHRLGVTPLAMMLIFRRLHEAPMLPAARRSALLCPLIVRRSPRPFGIATTYLRKLFLFGTTQSGLGLAFPLVGGRLVSA